MCFIFAIESFSCIDLNLFLSENKKTPNRFDWRRRTEEQHSSVLLPGDGGDQPQFAHQVNCNFILNLLNYNTYIFLVIFFCVFFFYGFVVLLKFNLNSIKLGVYLE